jgi:Zn-finger nucleic acid-binding protein
MKCPACASNLTEKQIGSICVQLCQAGCGGIWFDTFEVDQVDQETDTVGELLFQPERDSPVETDTSRPRNCPRCEGVQLKRVLLSPGSQVHISECPSCDGCWLDKRDLAALHDERVEMLESGRIQKTSSADLIRYLYAVRTGKNRQ